MGSRIRPDNIVETRRIYVVLATFLAVVGSLTLRLWYLQVLKGKDFAVASERNRFREVTRPAPRGLIFDSGGDLLLANRPFFDLVVIPQYLQDKEKTFRIVSELFHIPLEQISKKLEESEGVPKFVPVRIKRNLSLHEVALIESNKFFLPGIDVDTAPRRDYRRNESAHLFGYLGEVTPKELDQLNSRTRDFQYRVGAIIGKQGIEKKYEGYLRGQEGRDLLQVDAFGRLQTNTLMDLGSLQSKAARKGMDVYLTIDKDVQQAAIDAFRDKNGAVVAIDPRSGAVLAYVSQPNFPLSIYQDGLRPEDWQTIQSNPFKPLLDKVTGGAYPPGSTFKLITGIAAIEEGVVGPERTFFCNGAFSLGSGRWRCHKKEGHGTVNLRLAMEKSCDVYFYQVGNLLGVDRIAKWAKAFGLGELTGLDLNMELPGIAPSTEWKLRTRNQQWQQGDTINVSIGQGYNLTTPIQIANLYAAFGSGGKLFRPYLLQKVMDEAGRVVVEEKPLLRREVLMQPATMEIIRQSLVDVTERGTGTRAKVKGFQVAAKSGTAQTSALRRESEMDEVAFQLRDHAWFVAYAPANAPEISVVAFSEYDGGHGGSEAGPIAQKVLEAYLRKHHPDKFPEDPVSAVSAARNARQQEASVPAASPDVLPAEVPERPEAPRPEELPEQRPAPGAGAVR